ncbi:MAG: glycogen synthase GlgA [Clostridia bacterium]|nr:glycogen synthase GlgA [Clostridia bacterium]
MKVLFAASECVPFVKTGGLADVVGALPKELVKAGADVRVILPLYREMSAQWRSQLEHVLYFYINLGWRRQYCGIEKLVYEGVTFYFVDNEYYFGRPYIYGLGGDEGERYAFFSRAVLEALPQIDFIPDVLHCHDWQTGLIPALLNSQYRTLPHYGDIRTIFTVHNLQYQGIFPISDIEDLISLGGWAYDKDHLEFYGQCSFMKGGLVFADAITTVSPTYSQEIQTAYYGEKLDGLLRNRADSLTGILNGIDTIEYDPMTDPLIEHHYGPETFADKVQNKLALQKELGLEENADIPMIGMVGRLSGQKGLDLVEHVLDEIMATGAQLVVLGKGEEKYADLFSWAQWKYPGRIAARIEMNHGLAHKIYAASDLFLMPSAFEPCGLSQMIAMRYGTLPIVRETGGLRDTVLSYNEFTGEGSGFTFFNYNAHDMLHVIERAVQFYNEQRDIFNAIAVKDMLGSYGWDRSAKVYMELYDKTAVKPEAPAKPKRTRAKKTTEEGETAAPAKKRTTKKAASAEEGAAEKKVTRTKKAAAGETAEKKPRAPRKKKVAEETAEKAE